MSSRRPCKCFDFKNLSPKEILYALNRPLLINKDNEAAKVSCREKEQQLVWLEALEKFGNISNSELIALTAANAAAKDLDPCRATDPCFVQILIQNTLESTG